MSCENVDLVHMCLTALNHVEIYERENKNLDVKLLQRADFAMADLTINYQREQVVDFSQPFLDLGISLLFVNAPKK